MNNNTYLLRYDDKIKDKINDLKDEIEDGTGVRLSTAQLLRMIINEYQIENKGIKK